MMEHPKDQIWKAQGPCEITQDTGDWHCGCTKHSVSAGPARSSLPRKELPGTLPQAGKLTEQLREEAHFPAPALKLQIINRCPFYYVARKSEWQLTAGPR